MTMNRLARVYCLQKRYDDAEVLLTRVLQAREGASGSDHHHTLDT
jgi:hypothetical protein